MFAPLPDNGDDDDKVEIHSTPPLHQRCLTKLHLPSETFALINATFVAVATILGTGILALPVKLSHSGMGPFVFTFTLCLGMQLCTVVLMVELLQRTHAQIGVDTMQKKKQNWIISIVLVYISFCHRLDSPPLCTTAPWTMW